MDQNDPSEWIPLPGFSRAKMLKMDFERICWTMLNPDVPWSLLIANGLRRANKSPGRIPNTHQCPAASKKIVIRLKSSCCIQDITKGASPNRVFPSLPRCVRRSDTALKSCKSAGPSNNSGDRSPTDGGRRQRGKLGLLHNDRERNVVF